MWIRLPWNKIYQGNRLRGPRPPGSPPPPPPPRPGTALVRFQGSFSDPNNPDFSHFILLVYVNCGSFVGDNSPKPFLPISPMMCSLFPPPVISLPQIPSLSSCQSLIRSHETLECQARVTCQPARKGHCPQRADLADPGLYSAFGVALYHLLFSAGFNFLLSLWHGVFCIHLGAHKALDE